MPSHRIRRVNELVKQEVGELVRRDVNSDSSGLITVLDAEVSSDLRTARIYYSVIGTPTQQQHASALLHRYRTHVQRQMARRVILKRTPVLRFICDDSLERGDRILRLLEEIERIQATAEAAQSLAPVEAVSPKPRTQKPKAPRPQTRRVTRKKK